MKKNDDELKRTIKNKFIKRTIKIKLLKELYLLKLNITLVIYLIKGIKVSRKFMFSSTNLGIDSSKINVS